MASGDPVTLSVTAPQKQLPAWDIGFLFRVLSSLLRQQSGGKNSEAPLTKKSARRSFSIRDAMVLGFRGHQVRPVNGRRR
jgi:hypothetical protein